MKTFSFKAIALTAAASGLALFAQAQTGTNVYGDVWINLTLDSADTNTDYCIFTVRMLKDTWVGITLGTAGMAVGTDMI